MTAFAVGQALALLEVARQQQSDPLSDGGFGSLLGRSLPATENAFRQRAIDQGLARNTGRQRDVRARLPRFDFSGFGERELDALTEQIGAFRGSRFAGVSANDAPGGATRDLDGDGKNDMHIVCWTTEKGNEICNLVPIHTETEEERKEREREEQEERAREIERRKKELEKAKREKEEIRRRNNIRSTQECQRDPNCRLA